MYIDAEIKLNTLIKEREYLENQMFGFKKVFKEEGQEIIEPYIEKDDKIWREQHRENIRKYKHNKNEDESQNITDEELFNRLEELELQEELKNEYHNSNDDTPDHNRILHSEKSLQEDTTVEFKVPQTQYDNDALYKLLKENSNESLKTNDKLQQALHKQKELEVKLLELKNRDRGQTKTEIDLLEKLDELEELEELEDEMER